MRVRVYKNLTLGCYSVQEKTAKGWRVVRHVDSIVLRNVCFLVSESGRQRVLAEKRKNVHAYVEGNEIATMPTRWVSRVSYNPYKSGMFHTDSGWNVKESPYVKLDKKGCFIDGIRTRLHSLA